MSCQKEAKRLYGIICWEKPELCDVAKKVFDAFCQADPVAKRIASEEFFRFSIELGMKNIAEHICISNENPYTIQKRLVENGALELSQIRLSEVSDTLLQSINLTYWRNMVITKYKRTLYAVLFNIEPLEDWRCFKIYPDPRVAIVTALAVLNLLNP